MNPSFLRFDSEPASRKSEHDAFWSAMSDPSRREILELLRAASMTTCELSDHFEFSRFAVMKHLKILTKSGLVISERRGRIRLNHLNPVPLQMIYRHWVLPFEHLPADRLLKIKSLAERP